jgi:hypothetical protein
MLATLSHDGELATRRFVLTVDLRIAVMFHSGASAVNPAPPAAEMLGIPRFRFLQGRFC